MKKYIALIGVCLLLTGCAKEIPLQTQNKAVEQAPEAAVVEPAKIPPAEEVPNIEGDLYNIKNISVKNGATFIKVEKIKWLSGYAGTCSTPPEVKAGMPQCGPDGYLIRTAGEKLKTYQLLPDAIIMTTSVTDSLASTKMSPREFYEAYAAKKDYFDVTPFKIQIENGVIKAVQEMYIP
jgi:hypothetical protein